MELRTERLELIACTATVTEAALADPAEVGRLLGVRVPAGWPSNDLRDILPGYLRDVAADSDLLGWGPWVIVEAAGRVVVGDAGFHGEPDAARTVEIGYGILPAYRRRGYATEAARGLVGWAFGRPGVARVVAECEADNVGSIRVLERLGMARAGVAGSLLRWERAAPGRLAEEAR
ncbi:MAG TPA: GNAT family N-acetyltransferase [Thermomicrobiaceae bacterium]|nr:GNAT family N-acetyltransferase [Thermomicrobiaceae bacterium]